MLGLLLVEYANPFEWHAYIGAPRNGKDGHY